MKINFILIAVPVVYLLIIYPMFSIADAPATGQKDAENISNTIWGASFDESKIDLSIGYIQSMEIYIWIEFYPGVTLLADFLRTDKISLRGQIDFYVLVNFPFDEFVFQSSLYLRQKLFKRKNWQVALTHRLGIGSTYFNYGYDYYFDAWGEGRYHANLRIPYELGFISDFRFSPVTHFNLGVKWLFDLYFFFSNYNYDKEILDVDMEMNPILIFGFEWKIRKKYNFYYMNEVNMFNYDPESMYWYIYPTVYSALGVTFPIDKPDRGKRGRK